MCRQQRQGAGDFIDGTIAAAGDDGGYAELNRFRDVALRIALLPGDADE